LTPPHGVFNVPRDLLIDIDETGIMLYSSERGFGHALRGQRAVVRSHPARGTKYTLILAIARNGFVRWRITKSNTSTQTFLDFLHFNLNPALNERGFFLMMDNLSVHRTTVVSDYIAKSGHYLLFRPQYSPDFAPVESAFSKIKWFLKSHKYELDVTNLEDFIYKAICTITPADCEGWFRNCFY
jgi:transposase